MSKVQALIKERGYILIAIDRVWETWERIDNDKKIKIFVPLQTNTLIFYEYTINGSPKSSVEFHNYLEERQFERMEKLF